MNIDVHAHYWTDSYLDRIQALGKDDTDTQRGMGAGDGKELQDRLELMDRSGVDLQILSAAPQMPYSDTDRDGAVEAARFVNDQYAELVKEYPDRFRAFVALPMPHIEESLAELARGLDELGFLGVVFNTTINGRPLVDPEFAPIFEELNRRKAVVYIHPAGNSVDTPLIRDHHMTWMVGAPMEDTVSIMQLITEGFPTKYPDITFINSHLGGALPMLLQRADNQVGWEAPDTPEKPSEAARRMYFDSVGHGHVPAIRAAVDSFGADRILLGTDFPYEAGDIFTRAVEYIPEGLDEKDATAVLSGNAARLFPALADK